MPHPLARRLDVARAALGTSRPTPLQDAVAALVGVTDADLRARYDTLTAPAADAEASHAGASAQDLANLYARLIHV